MKIGIDGNEANIEEKVGVHQYAYELIHTFYRMRNSGETDHTFIIFLKNPPRQDLPQETEWWKYRILPAKGLWILTRLLPHLLVSKTCDVLFSPNHYLPLISTIPMICVIHDLGYLKYSAQFKKSDIWQLKYWSAISIYTAKHVITVSQSAKRDIVRHYPFALRKVTTVYHGYDKGRYHQHIGGKSISKVLNKYKIQQNYILYLGTLKPSKNINGLLDAFRIVKNNGYEGTLVIAGKKGWMYSQIFEKAKRLKLNSSVVFTDFVDEKDKPALLAGATLLVSPSFWEGFGMQVLESMAVGTPVVVSNVASLPEVAGSAGIYVNAESSKSIADGIETILSLSKAQYNKLKNENVTQAANFSWEKTAHKTLDIITKN